jgi:hypothetical protein
VSEGARLADILDNRVAVSDNRDLVEAVTSRRGSPFVALVLAPDVQFRRNMVPPLLEILDGLPRRGRVDLMLDRLGHACEEDWRLVSVLREYFDRYTAIVPFAASTGATQVALGADDLLMGEASSLAPLEPVRVRLADAEAGRVAAAASDLRYLTDFLHQDLGLDPDTTALRSAFEHLWSRMDPLSIGATAKAQRLQQLITRRCLETHLDAERDKPQIQRIVAWMCGDFISHSFPVTRRDCEHDLGLKVVRPDRATWGAIWRLYEYYQRMLAIEADYVLAEGRFTLNYDGFIDTLDDRRVLIRIQRVDERGRALTDKPALTRWVRPGAGEPVIDKEVDV